VLFEQLKDPDNSIMWPTEKTVPITGVIKQSEVDEDEAVGSVGYIREQTFAYATYFPLEQVPGNVTLKQLMNLNYVLPHHFQRRLGVSNRITWIYENRYLLVYPGITVEDEQ
jgi:hypothetical protein